MIYLGYSADQKRAIIAEYCRCNDIRSTVVIAPDQFPLVVDGADQVRFADVIMYVTFYRLLQEIDSRTLIVISDPLRTQNRYDLSYNCIRNFLNQTGHQLVFSHLPQIDEPDDFMVLFDFATRSRWKRHKFDIDLILDNVPVYVQPVPLDFRRVDVPTSAATKVKYAKERDKLFANLGAKDPHTLPRNLYLIGGKDKLAYIDAQAQPSLFGDGQPCRYVARNGRLKRDSIVTYTDVTPGCYTVVEFPHRFIDFADFAQSAGQAQFDVLVADLKVDRWYFDRYTEWKDRIHATYASLQQS